jgi:trehalose/maltose hydrolase-like predicted phosphorylase
MDHYGAELLLDISKFWISKSKLDDSDGLYHIDKVMGPDEFHEKLPGGKEGGLSDNAYTNIMVSWMLAKAFIVLENLTAGQKQRILDKLSITGSDLDHWKLVQKGLAVHISSEGIVEQFKGYFGLKELDWDHYRQRYDNIHRLDRILKAEGKSPDDYKLAKQADFLMAFYNLGESGVSEVLKSLGLALPGDYLEKNFHYYIERTSHGSTLSRLVHARLAWQMGMQDTGWGLYLDALRSDLVDIQGGTTGEGIHCGVMAGTVIDALYTFAGLDLKGEIPELNPAMPDHWKEMNFQFSFKGRLYDVKISQEHLKISVQNGGKEKIKVHLCGSAIELSQDEPVSIKYK